jgi:hypothetical protein
MVREPLMLPLMVGLNDTAIVQLDFAASELPHGAEPVPFAEKSPLGEKVKLNAVLWLLVTVAV